MKKTFSIAYKRAYFDGYSTGLNPLKSYQIIGSNEAFTVGFHSGRTDYERMNGSIIDGIPTRILTDDLLEEFLLAGVLGLPVDFEGYTVHQMNVIEKWHQSGIEKYDPVQNNELLEILVKNEIVLR